MVPTPMSVLVKDITMNPVVDKSAANWGIGRVSFSDNVSTFPLAVPTLIVSAIVSDDPFGAVGAM